mgnify:CR=1 FL=1
MSKLKRYLMIVLIGSLCFIFSGCFDSREVDDMAYAMAIGVDKGTANDIKLTLQFASTKGGGGEESSKSPGGGESPITTLETNSVFSGLNLANSYISKQINISHAKIIIFSEELAREGIHKYVSAFLRSREFRGSMYVAISKNSAEEFIRKAQPKLQANASRLFEAYFGTYRFTGFTTNSKLSDVYAGLVEDDSQAVATLAGVGKYKSSKEFSTAGSTYAEKGRTQPLEGDYKAGDIPKAYDSEAELMGLAVFNGSKMVGELDGQQSMMYLMVTGKYEQSYISFKDPKDESQYVLLNVKQSRIPEKKVDISGTKPIVHSKIQLEADIVSIDSGFNYESPENTPTLEAAAEEYLKGEMLQFLNKTAKEFQSDICGFGKEVKKKFLVFPEWRDYNWLSRYKDAEFTVDMDLKIRRPGLVVRPVEARSSEGKEF